MRHFLVHEEWICGWYAVFLHRTRLLLELRLLEPFSGATIDGVVCVMSSCGMSFLVALAQCCVRPRRHSSRLRLMSLSCITTGAVSARGKLCVPLRLASTSDRKLIGYALLFFSTRRAWLLAISSELLLTSNSMCDRSCFLTKLFFVFHTLCVDGTLVWVESVCLHSRARHWCRNPEALLRRAFRQPSACVTGVAGGVPWQIRPTPSRLLRVARLRLLTPVAVVASADQVPRGQRVPLDQFRTLLIDRSAESVESFLPSRSRTWRRSREHGSPAHAADPSRDSSQGSHRRHAQWTHLDLHVEAIVFCRRLRRQFSPLTHLELRVEVHCRSSFFVDSSRLIECPLSLGQFSVESHQFHSRCIAGLLLTWYLVVILGLVELTAPPGLWCAFSKHRHT